MGIDIGGTFTDLVLYNEDSRTTQIAKTTTTPENVFVGAKKGIMILGANLEALSDLTHGTTIGTNAIIQKSGARVVMVTTKGHNDILEVDSGCRGVLYDIRGRRAEPLVKRSWRFEVTERVLADGTILQALDLEELKGVLAGIGETGAQAVAVCFLHSYMRDDNEKKAETLIQKILPNLFVSISSKVSRFQHEFERFSTAVLNSYLGPLVSPYISEIIDFLEEGGYNKPLWIMSAAGATVGAEVAQQTPILTINSGPAAGVTASANLGKLLGYENVISYDMGGTSTDVSLIRSYQPSIIRKLGITYGYPNVAPQVDIETIGSGGGTIAWVDSDGAFQLGPQSMGAVPGPACYGLGGTEATITDAVLLLGWLNPNRPLGGEVSLNPKLAREAIFRIANLLKVKDVYKMAEAIVNLATTKMVGAIKVVSTGRGHDPRDFTLMAFGGAGPMFGTKVASELGITRVVVPIGPGNFSALGMLQSEVMHQCIQPVRIMTPDTSIEDLRSISRKLEGTGKEQLVKEGFSPENIHFEKKLEVRYPGQYFTLEVELTDSIEDLERAFYKAHEEVYHFAFSEPIMITNVIVNAHGSKPKAIMTRPKTEAKEPADALFERRSAWFKGRFIDTPAYRRDDLQAGFTHRGPVIFEELGTTTVVQPDWSASIDNLGNLILEKGE
jgi:N-methylhydantoinase A